MNVFDVLREKLEEKAFDMSLENNDCKAVWLDRAIEIVNQVEQEYNSGWISCSERLPEEYGEYLCCNKYGEFIVGYPIAKTLDDGFYVETDSEGLDFVVAWQPLPEPYIGEVIT